MALPEGQKNDPFETGKEVGASLAKIAAHDSALATGSKIVSEMRSEGKIIEAGIASDVVMRITTAILHSRS